MEIILSNKERTEKMKVFEMTVSTTIRTCKVIQSHLTDDIGSDVPEGRGRLKRFKAWDNLTLNDHPDEQSISLSVTKLPLRRTSRLATF